MAGRIGKVIPDVLAVIKPSPEEAEAEIAFANFLVDHISRNAPAGTETVLVGSMAKRTFLRDKRDIDIFVLFDPIVPRDTLETAVRIIMEKAFPTLGFQVSYAEHPYVRFHFEGRRIDLVPAYKITTAAERLSAVDRSVLHTCFVLDSLKGRQADEVLLLKQFLRSSGIYGAEIKVEGFSGYLCELLIIRYGSFIKAISAFSKWKDPVFIDLDGAYRKGEIAEARKRFGFMAVIDPTDRDRNVAAAVSKENQLLLISLSKAFLRRPSRDFFFREPEAFEDRLEKAAKGKSGYLISMPRPSVVDDVLWGQLKKMLAQLKEHLMDFKPMDIISDDSRHLVRLGIILEKDRLPVMMMLQGPPLNMAKHVTDFRKSHPKARFQVKGGKIFAHVKRPVTEAKESIRGFFHSFSKKKSHLAYPEEMLIIERLPSAARARKSGAKKKAKRTAVIKKARGKVIIMSAKKKSKPVMKKKAPVKKSKGKKK